MAPAIPLLAAVIGTAGTIGAAALSRPKTPKTAPMSAPMTPAPTPETTVGESTKLKPGERTNAIATSPQGVLSSATTGRQTLLGG